MLGARSAAVLGSSNLSTPKTLARAQTGCARGRTHSAKSIDAAVAAATPASQCLTRAEQKPVGAHGLPSKDPPGFACPPYRQPFPRRRRALRASRDNPRGENSRFRVRFFIQIGLVRCLSNELM